MPPPTPNRTPPTCESIPDPPAKNGSNGEQELRLLIIRLIHDVEEMRFNIQSLATEVNTLKQQHQQQEKYRQFWQPLHAPLSEPNLSPRRTAPKTSIIKNSTTSSHYAAERCSTSSSSTEEDWSSRGSQRTSLSTGTTRGASFPTHSTHSRCVKFNLPEKPRKNHKERNVHKSEKRRDSREVFSDPCDASPTSPESK